MKRFGCRDKVDFHIDGSHNFEQVLMDFFCVDGLFKRGVTLVFDDVDWGRPEGSAVPLR